jgi:hypothetical protein
MTAMTYGIQSLLLGGGFGFLTGQHGLVIDNLLQVRSLASPDRLSDDSYIGYYRYREWDDSHAERVRKCGLVLGNPRRRFKFWCLHGVCPQTAPPAPHCFRRQSCISGSRIG